MKTDAWICGIQASRVACAPYKIADGKNIDKPTKRSDVVSGARKMSLVSGGGGGRQDSGSWIIFHKKYIGFQIEVARLQ